MPLHEARTQAPGRGAPRASRHTGARASSVVACEEVGLLERDEHVRAVDERFG